MPDSRFRTLILNVVPIMAAFVGVVHADHRDDVTFEGDVQPLLKTHCMRCHNADEMESGVRVDHLDGTFPDRTLSLWKGIRRQIVNEAMPPEDEPQPSAQQRTLLADWIEESIVEAMSRKRENSGSVRRLTVSQYRNTLADLLGLKEDLTGILPPDGLSKDGFANNGQTLLLSPLLVESYFDIAEKALNLCIVDEATPPVIQTFRMDLGEAINEEPCPDELILGANSLLLANEDFVVTELSPEKPFDFDPFEMQKEFRFVEGYQGNDTVRGWREFHGIYHAVFACMRGNEGYPQGRAYEVIPEGLLLRPAIPSEELFGVESTYGPRANFKVSLRELPDQGNFRVTVKAARYDDGLLLDAGATSQPADVEGAIVVNGLDQPTSVTIERPGVYQADVYLESPEGAVVDPNQQSTATPPVETTESLSLRLGTRHFSGALNQPAFVVVRLPSGTLNISAQCAGEVKPARMVLTPLDASHDVAKRFAAFEKRSPLLGVHLGLRRDCGSTLNPVGEAQAVTSEDVAEYVCDGAINNFPSPDQATNFNYLTGFREIGVRSEFTDGRDMPRLLIRSIEFEGPYYEQWPPATHRQIFIESDKQDDPEGYASDIIQSFASRAFRRPITDEEFASLLEVWRASFDHSHDFHISIKDTLLVVLTSPQFLFLIEESEGPEDEPLNSYELASKLSYFLWDTAPDNQLLELAAGGTLHRSLDAEISRMIGDSRFQQFEDQFASQWLQLDKFDVVEIDRSRYPTLRRDTRTHLRREPAQTLDYLIQQNLPLRCLVQSDIILANDVVANYYGLANRTESGFEFVPVEHHKTNLGGILSQASILAGLSDGRESNPVKRGAWLARKIIAEPPDDPPPNVPQISNDDPTLTLREKLEVHRNQKGCVKCHAGIDPWGLPFETFDAAGLFKDDATVDASSTLPDQTEVHDLNELKAYLAEDRIDRVAFSFLKHLASYATGRTLTYYEMAQLEQQALSLQSEDYRMQDLIRFVIKSDIFLKK
ncbi:MAG: DUF1592 domain-containing protein [Planctomycetaceae bacterium]|nr:DUF1592 domain-containing protein [Planctomycetaceae bacterium]